MPKENIFFSKKTDNWSTPKAFYDQLDKIWHFDHDPCPLNSEQESLGFFAEWGFMNYVNPPYSNITQFLQTAVSLQKEGKKSIFLLPVRTSVKWFHELVLPNATRIEFIKGRLTFGVAHNPAPFESMLVYFL